MNFLDTTRESAFDSPSRLVPDGDGFLKIRIIGHVAADGGVIAESGVLNRRTPRRDRLKEIPEMLAVVLISRWRVKGGTLERALRARFCIVLLVPVLDVLRFHLLVPAWGARLFVET